MIKVGDMVETAVYRGNERVPMASGRVVRLFDGLAEVDIMSHHGGAPWITLHDESHLRKIEESK